MRILKFEGWDLIFLQVPGWVILLIGGLVVLLMAWYYFLKLPIRSATVRYSDLSLVRSNRKTLRQRLRPLVFILRILAVACLFVALARPQSERAVRAPPPVR